jgi:hypothetical protein
MQQQPRAEEEYLRQTIAYSGTIAVFDQQAYIFNREFSEVGVMLPVAGYWRIAHKDGDMPPAGHFWMRVAARSSSPVFVSDDVTLMRLRKDPRLRIVRMKME